MVFVFLKFLDKEVCMRRRKFKLEFKKGKDTTELIGTSCWHIGNPECRTKKITEMLQTGRPWVMLGDIIEAITPIDPRFHAETHSDTILNQCEYAASFVGQFGDTLIGTHIGNHEDKVSSKVGDVARLVLTLAGLVKRDEDSKYWLGGVCDTTLKCPGGVCKLFTGHSKLGFSGVGTNNPERDQLNKQIKLRRVLKPWKADLKLIGHGHRTVIAPPVFTETLSNGKMIKEVISPEWCAMAPSLFGQYDISDRYPAYSELAMYGPTDIGWVVATIHKDGRVLNVRKES